MARGHRAAMIGRYGQNAYRALHSLGSILGLGLMVYGFGVYRATGWIDVWQPPLWTRHLALTLTLPVFVLLAATVLPGWIKAMAKHPTLLAVKIWATAHLLANGDLGSILLFGSFLAWAVMARISMKGRPEEQAGGPAPAFGRNDLVALALGLAGYAAMVVWLHPWLIGVRVLP